jgi:hypothetical protein
VTPIESGKIVDLPSKKEMNFLQRATNLRGAHRDPGLAALKAHMKASRHHASAKADSLPDRLPNIELRHGQALWVLSRLGFQGNATKSTFYEYIKSLKKLGTPFGRGKIGLRRRGLANYSYCHLMELALALTLRVYNIVPDTVLAQLVRYRRTLYRHYNRAYAERRSGLGAPIDIEMAGHTSVTVRGVFLDLKIDFSGGTLTAFGPPELLSPYGALSIFIEREIAARALLPINVSLLSERLVSAALEAARADTEQSRLRSAHALQAKIRR